MHTSCGRGDTVAAVVTLAEGLGWLDQHINLEATAGRIEGLSLERMRLLASVLGDPQANYPVIHLTGTNGKGSTARMVTGLLVESGLTVGTYTSPHVERINERIARNGEPIDDRDLAQLLADVRPYEDLVTQRCSYFELITAAALRWFDDVAVDVAVVEVGLLGRYDATNICDATVAVITNVGHDHSDFEGDWRQRIAEEKSGIVKPASTLVLGETDPELLPIFYRSGAAEVWERERDFECERNDLAVGGRVVDLRTPSMTATDVFVPLHGAHQGDNAACALAAVEAFFGQRLDDDVIAQGFASVAMPGRFEVVQHNPLLVLDAAHNPEGASAAAATLRDDFEYSGETIVVIGMLQNRDPAAVLEALEIDGAAIVVVCKPNSPRALDVFEVSDAARQFGVEVIVEPHVADAVDRALTLAGDDDAVLVTGSFYVVGEARAHLRDQ
jgi:dihydrofolate synthase/folylpolyglutamate synthase